MVFTPFTNHGASCDVVKIPSVPVKQPIGSEAQDGYDPPRSAEAISVPLIHTEVVSSASTSSHAEVTGPFKVNVCEKVTAVPLTGAKNPGAEVMPVSPYETQLEPAKGPAHAVFPTIFCVALPELFVVFVAELAPVTLSAFAGIRKQPLAKTKIANFFNIFPPNLAGSFPLVPTVPVIALHANRRQRFVQRTRLRYTLHGCSDYAAVHCTGSTIRCIETKAFPQRKIPAAVPRFPSTAPRFPGQKTAPQNGTPAPQNQEKVHKH